MTASDGEAGGHRERAALEGRGVHHDLVHGRVDRAEDLVRRQHRADRDVAAGQRLGHGHDVGLHVVVLVGEEPSGAAEAGLNLVADQQRAVLVQQRLRLRQEPGRRHHDAVPLDRLHDQGGDVALAQFCLERGDVAKGNLRAWQQRAEACLEFLGAVNRQRPGGQAVEAVPRVQDAALAGRVPGELERGLDGLRAAVAEEHALQAGRLGQQLLPEEAHNRLAVELRPRREVHVERVLQRLLDHRVRASGREHAEPGKEVGVRVAFRVVQVRALAANVVPVEPDGVQGARQLGIQVLAVQVIPLPAHRRELSAKIEAHITILITVRGSSPAD